jgi:excisionase family DNA binding protein
MRRFMSVREVADHFGLAVGTVRRHIRTGEIAAVRIGGNIRVSDTEIRRLEIGRPA